MLQNDNKTGTISVTLDAILLVAYLVLSIWSVQMLSDVDSNFNGIIDTVEFSQNK